MASLEGLPNELRYQIYQFIFPSFTDYQCFRVPTPTYNKSILQLNREIRSKALPIFYRRRRFCFQNKYDITDYVGCLDPLARALIESIVVGMSTPPHIGYICDFIRPVDLGLRQMSAIKDLELKITLSQHDHAAKLGLDFTKLVRPLFSISALLKITMVRCLCCHDILAACPPELRYFTHHQWVWEFTPGAVAPQIRRRFEGSLRPLVRDRLLACGSAIQKFQSPSNTGEILLRCKRFIVQPALSENKVCGLCLAIIRNPSTLKELLEKQCPSCGMDRDIFCSQECKESLSYLRRRDGTNFVPHYWVCVGRGWSAKEKSSIQIAINALDDLENDDNEDDDDEIRDDGIDVRNNLDNITCLQEKLDQMGI